MKRKTNNSLPLQSNLRTESILMNNAHEILLSVIVPVYNVEQYIRSCIESIYKQGFSESSFEVIVVNDGTQDNSMDMIADIVQQHHNIHVFHQENQGLSVARNHGLGKARGEYVLMVDSDDLLIENSLAPLLSKALSTKVDLIMADFLQMNDDEIKQRKSTPKNPIEFVEKTGKELFLEDLNPNQCYVWRFLYRRAFLMEHQLSFVPGIRFQDVPFTHECLLRANKCLRASWLLNIYRSGHLSASSGPYTLKKAHDMCIAIGKTWELNKIESLSTELRVKLCNDIFTSFSLLTCCVVHDMKDSKERIQVIDDLTQLAPEVKFINGKKQIITTLLLHSMPHTYIRLRWLYGKVFEDRIFPALKKWRRNES